MDHSIAGVSCHSQSDTVFAGGFDAGVGQRSEKSDCAKRVVGL